MAYFKRAEFWHRTGSYLNRRSLADRSHVLARLGLLATFLTPHADHDGENPKDYLVHEREGVGDEEVEDEESSKHEKELRKAQA